jgi:hypothetical protein
MANTADAVVIGRSQRHQHRVAARATQGRESGRFSFAAKPNDRVGANRNFASDFDLTSLPPLASVRASGRISNDGWETSEHVPAIWALR